MTIQLTLSALDIALTDCLAHREHFMTMTEEGVLCRICSHLWETPEAWADDNGYCPGYVTCGLEPVPGAEHRLRLPS